MINLIYIHSHDTGRYISPYGHALSTPHLQRFAEGAMVFRNAHCAGPTCSPSRAALLTGQYPHQTGMLGLAHRGFALHHPQRLIHRYLQQNGYWSGLSGTQHVFDNHEVDKAGYDWRPAEKLAPHHAARQFLQIRRSQPFFLDVGFDETHRMGRGFTWPANTPGDGSVDSRFVAPPSILPDTQQTRRDMADYQASVQRLDYYVGEVLQALEQSGHAEDTLVMVTTDHGIAFPGMKCSLTSHGTGVMLMLRGPKGFEGGKVCDALVSHLDLYPTICEVLGLASPGWLEGQSLVPLANGDKGSVRDELFAEVTFHAAFEPKRSLRTPKYNYIVNYSGQFQSGLAPVLPNCDESLSKDTWLNAKGHCAILPGEELYDLMLDPQERVNLAKDVHWAPILGGMRERMNLWMKRTDDVLLQSIEQWAVPPQVVVNRTRDTSPEDPTMLWSDFVMDLNL